MQATYSTGIQQVLEGYSGGVVKGQYPLGFLMQQQRKRLHTSSHTSVLKICPDLYLNPYKSLGFPGRRGFSSPTPPPLLYFYPALLKRANRALAGN